MKQKHIVEPKLIKRKCKTIIVVCGGNKCKEVRELIYTWWDDGEDKMVCTKCGRINHFEIPVFSFPLIDPNFEKWLIKNAPVLYESLMGCVPEFDNVKSKKLWE